MKTKSNRIKKGLTITIVCTVSFLLFNCKGNVQKVEGDSNGAKTITLSSIEESFPDTSYFRPSKAVVLEMTEESLISEISRIAMDDNMLFIYCGQSDELFMFDINGKYISKIDCKGEGPNEYLQTSDFTIDTATKQIILLCAIPEKRMYFTYKGEFIKQEKNPEYFSLCATEGNHIYFENSSGHTTNQLYILNTKTAIIKENLKTLDIKTRFFANGNSISRCKNILYVRRFDNTIYELKNGEIIEKYRVDFKNHSFPEYFLTEEDDNVISRESRTHDYIYSMTNATENDHYLMFYTNRGLFIYDKKKDLLTGYKKILHSKLEPIKDYIFLGFLTYFSPIENTNMIACVIDDLESIKNVVEFITEEPDNAKVKKIRDKYPELTEEIVRIGNQLTDESNPVLFIYEFKD